MTNEEFHDKITHIVDDARTPNQSREWADEFYNELELNQEARIKEWKFQMARLFKDREVFNHGDNIEGWNFEDNINYEYYTGMIEGMYLAMGILLADKDSDILMQWEPEQ